MCWTMKPQFHGILAQAANLGQSVGNYTAEQFKAEYPQFCDADGNCHLPDAMLEEIVKMVGMDALSPADRLTMETAKSIREDFLQQNAFVDEDAYSSYSKQFRLLDMILSYDTLCRNALTLGADMNSLFVIAAREKIGRAKMANQDTFEEDYAAIAAEMKAEIDAVVAGGEEA